MSAIYAPQGTVAAADPAGQQGALWARPGNSAIAAVGAASVNVALPKDTNSRQYKAVILNTTAACWVQFCTAGADAVVAATAPAFLINPGAPYVCGVPAGAGFLAVIEASATTGNLSIVGVF